METQIQLLGRMCSSPRGGEGEQRILWCAMRNTMSWSLSVTINQLSASLDIAEMLDG